jgi:hypothetical protein
MRPLLALSLAALLAAAFAGCTSPSGPVTAGSDAPLTGTQFSGAPDQGVAAAGSPHTHGAPKRDDGSVSSGPASATQIPSAWASRWVNITNDFAGADRANVFFGVQSGSITIVPGNADGYRVEAFLEARALTEQEARDSLDRVTLTHTDTLEPDGLHVKTLVEHKPAQSVIPGVQIGLSDYAWADVTVYLPSGPAYELGADTSSGSLDVSGLRGPSFLLSTSSGDLSAHGVNAGNFQADTSSGSITLDSIQASTMVLDVSSGSIDGNALRVGNLKANSSSGDITLKGVIDSLDVDASSGSLDLDAHGDASGAYKLGASSGSIALKVLSDTMRAYKVTADASSGSVTIDMKDAHTSNSKRGDHAEATSDNFAAAAIQTVVDLSTSSGDITVTG